MILLLYLDSPRINQQASVASHFRALSESAGVTGLPVSNQVVFTSDSARRELQASRTNLVYLLGHSEGKGGMVIGGKPSLDGRALSAWLPRRAERLPRVIMFNTCDAISSGLVNAALEAGVATVIAARGLIPIEVLCPFGEVLFQSWFAEKVSLAMAIKKVNEEFEKTSVSFEVFGEQAPSLTSES